ncbi:MAG: hypothetical protein ACPGLY_10095 [Rubripirellula sp.]
MIRFDALVGTPPTVARHRRNVGYFDYRITIVKTLTILTVHKPVTIVRKPTESDSFADKPGGTGTTYWL